MNESIDFVEIVRDCVRTWRESQVDLDESKTLSEEQILTLATALWANRFDSTNKVFEDAVYQMIAIRVENL